MIVPVVDSVHTVAGPTNVVVVDYGRGNLFGLVHALQHIGADPVTSSDHDVIRRAASVILPGVGAYSDAMTELDRRGLVGPLIDVGRSGVPFLGICVGCQVMLEVGEEHGLVRGLGLFPGRARRLPDANDGKAPWRIPNVGWRSIFPTRPDTIFSDVTTDMMVYFSHSYAPAIEDTRVVAAVMPFNGLEVPVALRHRNLVGVQFHPERSGPVGLDILRRFISLPSVA